MDWTSRLDAFTMMQLGAAIAEHLPLQLADDAHMVQILDEVPGWIGDGGKHSEADTTDYTGYLGICYKSRTFYMTLLEEFRDSNHPVSTFLGRCGKIMKGLQYKSPTVHPFFLLLFSYNSQAKLKSIPL
ncbi:hypothetical protein CERZMDRAFT_99664 [Cercospora zeae-maydis SCOH1-5]|uniref:Uncharacterized protein n=1 Tax=Cercospora zeae-maydis SCOH1-5 TaxID=717836 RepID=A0A6A6FA25_9PEZI|nr:hypothetical protein CERZMDRAFT_99664 [Cercospora zeae-maydis SCOH1-5]